MDMKVTLFSKILVANRGEIACRIMRTAQKMGISVVAVYSEADANAPHVKLADEAVLLGPAASSESYLKADKVIEAALATGAEAIHPGYGFLSENAGFVEAVKKAGLVFIGPDLHAIRVMGDKIESKALAISAGVSCVPGTDGAVSTIEDARAAAAEIGYPVMVKASAGGGGKGMRVIDDETQMAEGMRAAMTEARNAFGDDRVFIEKFVVSPRHIEIQVLADSHGNVVYLGERECSVQRRHQKVVEEAPSAFITDDTRKKMGEQAVQLARAVDYLSAGTVEFIVGADQDFYFLEMNTRLQVEHPVTEQVYGIDLVEWMIRIAAGDMLDVKQADIIPQGWSIEARLYAEDSERGFLPSIGQLMRYRQPVGEGVRCDTGVEEGSKISIYYDPMIAKLIATAPTREEAIDRLILALSHYQISGVSTNRQFLTAILADSDFRAGNMDTGFIADKFGDAFAPSMPADDQHICQMIGVAASHYVRAQARMTGLEAGAVSLVAQVVADEPVHYMLCWSSEAGSDLVSIGDTTLRITGQFNQPQSKHGFIYDGAVNDVPVAMQIIADDNFFTVSLYDKELKFRFYSEKFAPMLAYMPVDESGLSDALVAAPMPGLLTNIMVAVGDIVQAGQNVAIIEAMKMENTLTAGMKGRVVSIMPKIGDSLNVDDVIIELEAVGDDE
ncbi:MAG: acetyl/propionyl/methylcrotonyl-CoA carboxylase subunit alpha [Candidatus Puniceispirillaceae bacterium]